MSKRFYGNHVLRGIRAWTVRGTILFLVLQTVAQAVTFTVQVTLVGGPSPTWDVAPYVLVRYGTSCPAGTGSGAVSGFTDLLGAGVYNVACYMDNDTQEGRVFVGSGMSSTCFTAPPQGGTIARTIIWGGGLNQTGPAPTDRYITFNVQNKTITVKTYNVKNSAGEIVGVMTIAPGATESFTYHSPTGAQNLTLEVQGPNGEVISTPVTPTDLGWSSNTVPEVPMNIVDSWGIVGNINGDGTIDFNSPIGTPADDGTLRDAANAIATTIQQGDAVQSAKLTAIQAALGSVNTVLGVIAGTEAAAASSAVSTAVNTSAIASNTAGIGGKLDGIGSGIAGVKESIDGLTFPVVDPRPNIDALPESMKAKGVDSIAAAGSFDSAGASAAATSAASAGIGALTGVSVPYAAPTKPAAGGAWTITLRGEPIDFNPMNQPFFVDTAALSWKILFWFVTAAYALLAWKTISKTVREASQVPQAVTAGTTILGTNINSVGALGMAAIIVVVIAAIPVAGVILFGSAVSIAPLAVDPLSGFGGAVATGINLAFEFIPIGQICTLAGAYFALQVSCDVLFLAAMAIVKFAVGS